MCGARPSSCICIEGPSYTRGKFGATFEPSVYRTQDHRFVVTPTCLVPKTLLSLTFMFFPVTLLQRPKYAHEANTVKIRLVKILKLYCRAGLQCDPARSCKQAGVCRTCTSALRKEDGGHFWKTLLE